MFEFKNTQEEKDAKDFGDTLRMTPNNATNPRRSRATPNTELKVITQVTQPLPAKLNLFGTNGGKSNNDLPSDSADYSPIAMSPAKTMRNDADDKSSMNKLASQGSQIECLSIRDIEKNKSQLMTSLDLNPLNGDITIISEHKKP